MELPVVGVVIPTYRRPQLLIRALRSVLAQEGVAVDVVVVDDARDQRTTELLGAFLDRQVRVVFPERSSGASAARNLGASLIWHRWIAFLDDDDLWAPTKLARQLEAMREGGARWSCTGTVLFTGPGEIVGMQRGRPWGDDAPLISYVNLVAGSASSVLCETSLFRETGGFDTAMTFNEDWDEWIRMSATGPPAVVDEPLVGYRVHPSNRSLDAAAVARFSRILTERADLLPIPALLRRRGGFLQAQYLLSCYTGAGDRRGALVALGMAVRGRRPRYLALAMLTAVAPSAAHRVSQRRMRTRVDQDWVKAARTWLSSCLR